MLYQLIKPVPVSTIDVWSKHLGEFRQVVGFSLLGHIFLRSTACFAVLYPFQFALKKYKQVSNLDEFEATVLGDPDFVDQVLRPEHVNRIISYTGELEPNEVIIPMSYPFLGGDERPDSYQIGDVWVFLELVGQAHGH